MFLEAFGAVRQAQAWSDSAPRHHGEFVFGPDGAEPVVFGVFGDSVGCGLGVARVERTFAGAVSERLARERRVLCRIRAESGARGRALAAQLSGGDEAFAAVSIGTNDLIHGESLRELEISVCALLGRLHRARRVVVLGPGPLDSALIVPSFLRPLVASRILACEAALRRAVDRFANARHFGPRDFGRPLTAEHFAPDGFHPSENGHALIAEAVYARLTT
jgi:lysophospholipase L1-like esterase